jgi:hypothetical protein
VNAGALADENHFRFLAHQSQYVGRHERVGGNHIRRFEKLRCAKR